MLVHSYKSFIKEASTNPFTIEWYMKMQDTINANSNAHAHFTLLDKKFHNQPTLKDLSTIFEYFYKQHRVMIKRIVFLFLLPWNLWEILFTIN